jgi:3-oxoadipate enol-lactonase
MAQVFANHITVEYRLDGPQDGPLILLSNSLASNLTMWDKQVPALTGAGLRVLRYDTRGHGGTHVTRGPYSLEILTQDAVALLDALGIDSAHVLGCSMGGMVAQRLATLHPQRVRALVLSATACRMPQPEVWDQRTAAVREGGMEAVADSTIDRWFTKAGQQRLVDDVARVRAMITRTPPEGFCGCCAAIRDMDQGESIRGITAPTLVLVGEEDPGTPVSAAQAIHERIAGSTLRVIPGAAHFVNVEQADAFNAALLDHLSADP